MRSRPMESTGAKVGYALSEGYSFPLYASMAEDTNASSPYVNSPYVSAVILPGDYSFDRVVVSASHDGGKTWTVAPAEPPQGGYTEDGFTNLSVARVGT